MSSDSLPRIGDLPETEMLHVEEQCNRFEKAWKAWREGQPKPSLEKHLEGFRGIAHDVLLCELLRLELAYRRRHHEVPTPAEYLPHFLEHEAWLRGVFEENTLGGQVRQPSTGPFHPAGPAPGPVPTPDRGEEGWRFARGDFIAKRYRIVSRLGRGGMGEVYCADDLRLEQPVALKFLPADVAKDPKRLALLRHEVKLARRVAHPNVCRVYDLADHDGQPFLTMEFIDGEDLASLLRRIGRLPEDTGIEKARQLCSALAAVHEQGLLHRDLKPGNVMLDGRGQVRLTDFGLAVAAESIAPEDIGAGTPAYMAPEQLAGKEVTARSDLFALGLVLYEMFTGKKPFHARSRADLLREYAEGAPSKPSSHVSGLNPAVERVIVRCLERDPQDRPRSVYDVLAALPGGDPLAAAVAAGETPSPEMVAEAGESGQIHPVVGLALLAALAGGLVLTAALNEWTALFRLAPFAQPGDEMARKARQILADLGHTEKPADSSFHFRKDWPALQDVLDTDLTAGRWENLAARRPAVVQFFYRQSPEVMTPDRISDWPALVTPTYPPATVPGMAGVLLDCQGRLLDLYVVPPRKYAAWAGSLPDQPDVPLRTAAFPLLRAAGLERHELATPAWVPPVYCDARAAWVGSLPDQPDVPLRVEAGGFQGKVVWFRMIAEPHGGQPASGEPAMASGYSLPWLCVLPLGLFLALRNLRRRRGDVRGALRLGLFILACSGLSWVFGAHHTSSLWGGMLQLMAVLGVGTFYGAIYGLVYLAVEPAVRRRWPWRLTASSRVLAGRFRSPLVGRDLLIGLVVGVFLLVLTQGLFLVQRALALPPRMPLGPGRYSFAVPVPLLIEFGVLPYSITAGLWIFLIAFLLFLFLRKPWLYWPAFVTLMGLWLMPENGWPTPGGLAPTLAWAVLYWTVLAVVVSRFGVWCCIAQAFAVVWLPTQPLTLDTSAWYFQRGLIGGGVILGLGLYGFLVSAKGLRHLLRVLVGDD
jgi:serine/threonine-protein kinase